MCFALCQHLQYPQKVDGPKHISGIGVALLRYGCDILASPCDLFREARQHVMIGI